MQPVVTYQHNAVVSPYVRRRNLHVEQARLGIARSGVQHLTNGNTIIWRVDEAGHYHECTLV